MDWLQTLISTVFSVGFVSAVFAYLQKLGEARAKARAKDANEKQQARSDEVGVLQAIIADLRNALDATNERIEKLQVQFERRLNERSKEMEKIRDNYTACIMERERLMAHETMTDLRIKELESVVAELRKRG